MYHVAIRFNGDIFTKELEAESPKQARALIQMELDGVMADNGLESDEWEFVELRSATG